MIGTCVASVGRTRPDSEISVSSNRDGRVELPNLGIATLITGRCVSDLAA
jgi:hypothetical protein